MKTTLHDLAERAIKAIQTREPFIYDIASEYGQIAGNVARMRWFRLAVMKEIASTNSRYSHLAAAIPGR